MPRCFSGSALRTARQNAGLTVDQVAAAVGRSVWTVYRLETERSGISVELADALAEAVGVPLEALLWSDPLAVAS